MESPKYCLTAKQLTDKVQASLSIKKQPIKVLLVEDDKICQIAQTALLENCGCTVEVAADGEQAIAMFDDSYDAIILDYSLPDMKGLNSSLET